jgi:hypothetical protein
MFQKGEANIRYSGGKSHFINHNELKKIRKRILKERGEVCERCGKFGSKLYHKDGSRDNHSDDNLIVLCQSCLIKENVLRGKAGCPPKWSKRHIKISKELGIPSRKIDYYLKYFDCKNCDVFRVRELWSKYAAEEQKESN